MKWVKHFTAVMLLGTTVSVACSSDSDDDMPPGGSGSGGMGDAGDTGSVAGDTGTEKGGTTGAAGATSMGGTTSTAGAGGEAGTPPPDMGCGRFQEICETDEQCCSRVCDMATLTCASPIGSCRMAGESCEGGTDCCTLRCEGGECSAEQCISDGEACASNAECCGGQCIDDTCQALNPDCSTAGNVCNDGSDCCSQVCGDDGLCTLGASYCIQPGDACIRNEDCCSADCSKGPDELVGTCGDAAEGSTFCEGVDGVVCQGCGDCCSRLCAPYARTGVTICQPISGCHSTGDLCRTDADCCGGDVPMDDADKLPGWGNGQCQIEEGHLVGVCRNPINGEENPDGACSPQGNVCHYNDEDYECNVSSARSNCCAEMALGNSGLCQLDALGIPRCNGLADCREEGETCATAADCCDGRPCVPDAQGVLRCGTDECVPVSGACTFDGDCCPGGTCYRPAGSLEGTCQPPTGEGGAGGGGPGCSTYAQQCGTTSDCCDANADPPVVCSGGICKYAPN
jgi:hypothetical protein